MKPAKTKLETPKLLYKHAWQRIKNRVYYSRYECYCGNTFIAVPDEINRGHTKSCGCLRKKANGLYKSPEYKSWISMKSRCYAINTNRYESYSARGIKVCEEWKNSFITFYKDMGQRPSDKYSLDRIDNDKGYSKDNCRWATAKQQANNRSNNIRRR